MTKDNDPVNHPSHYTDGDPTYETIKVIEAWKLNFHLGNCVKYISRAGKKDASKHVEDLEKARWYLDREINRLKAKGTVYVTEFKVHPPSIPTQTKWSCENQGHQWIKNPDAVGSVCVVCKKTSMEETWSMNIKY